MGKYHGEYIRHLTKILYYFLDFVKLVVFSAFKILQLIVIAFLIQNIHFHA